MSAAEVATASGVTTDAPAPAAAVPKSSTLKLNPSAKPFTFNPNAKSFTWTPQPVVQPVIVKPPRITYSHAEIFALQQPLYSGSSLIISPDCHDLSEILLYDPTFDYISAGFITAVPIDQEEPFMPGTGEMEQMDGLIPEYDMIMPSDATFNTTLIDARPSSTKTSPKKSKSKNTSPKKSHTFGEITRSIPATAQPSPTKPDGPTMTGETSDNSTLTNNPELTTVIISGIQQPHPSPDPSEDEDECRSSEPSPGLEGESNTQTEEESADDEENEEEADEREGGNEGDQQPPAGQQPYIWSQVRMPGSSSPLSSTADDIGIRYQASQKYYYYNNIADPFFTSTSSFTHGDTSLHADRRRQKQSAYFSHFTSHSPQSHSPTNRNSRSGKNGGTYSPPLMATRRDLYFQQDLHLHMNELYYYKSSAGMNANRRMYTRDTLLELGAKEQCQEKPANLPHYLSDIYKDDSIGSSNRSRSLFGNSTSSSSNTSRGIFGSSLQANTNHSLPGPDGTSGVDADGLPPKRVSKLKSKRKKNKDRSERSMEDAELPLLTGGRHRLNSLDQDDPTDGERKEDGPTLVRGLSTPKVKAVKAKGKKSGKKGGAASRDHSPVHKKGGGKSRHHGHQVESDEDEFENATMEDLHHCENAWQRSSALTKANQDALLLAEKTVRSILNKLSVDKLSILIDSLLSTVDIDSHRILQVIVDVIFEKSVDEPAFAELYAKFCREIVGQLPEFTIEEEKKTYSFRTMLLTKCYTLLVEDEESFTQSLHHQHPDLTTLELNDKLAVLKCHQKGNLIFIGELFKQSLLRCSVIHLCLDMLLEDENNEEEGGTAGADDITNEPSEWSVECVCIFLNTVGKKLDSGILDADEIAEHEAGGIDLKQLRQTRAQLVESHFRKITLLSRNKSLPSRFRFMLLDLLDLRARKWVPRMKKTVDPQSLQEIRDEAAATGLTTPMHSNKHVPMTTGGKKGAAPGLQKSASVYQPHLRTTVKPAFNPVSSSNPFASLQQQQPTARSFQGRALNFGSPLFHRSASAPDHHLTSEMALMHTPIVPGAAKSSSTTTPTITPGKYLPMWKRRELGLVEGGVLPRSKITEEEHQVEGAAQQSSLNFDDAIEGHQHDEGADQQEQDHDSPSFTATTEPYSDLTTSTESHISAASSAFAATSSMYSLETIQHELEVLVDEYYSSHDLTEACLCFTELEQHGPVGVVAQQIILPLFSKAVEQKSIQRELCCKLLLELFQRQFLRVEELLGGLQDWLNLLPDIVIDIPHAPTYTNDILAQLIIQHRLTIVQLLPLYQQPIQDGLLIKSDAANWIMTLLTAIRTILQTPSNELTAATNQDEINNKFLALIGQPSSKLRPFVQLFDDANQARARLEAQQFEQLIPILIQ